MAILNKKIEREFPYQTFMAYQQVSPTSDTRNYLDNEGLLPHVLVCAQR